MFGVKLKELRKDKGWTQQKLALLLECNQSMIARWEKQECEPTESIIRRTAIIFGVTSDYILGLEDESGRKIEKEYTFNNSLNNNAGNINFN